MSEHKKEVEPVQKGTWVKYGHFHLYSTLFGFFAGCAVSYFYIAVRVFDHGKPE